MQEPSVLHGARASEGVLGPPAESWWGTRRIFADRVRRLGALGDEGLARPALLGFVATLAITIGGSQPGSPFALKQPGAWFFGTAARGGTAGEALSTLAVLGGFALLLRVWYELAQDVRTRGGVPARKLAVVFAIWVLPLLFAPPLFSRDVYSYAAQGDMVSHGINPYRYGPDVLGANPYVFPVDPRWGNTPAPYGPLFLGLDGALVELTAHHELWTVEALRLLELGGVVLAAAFLPELARREGRDGSVAFVLAILNPVTLLGLVAAAHNDALMAGLLVAGLALAKRGRPLLGVVLCTLAAAVKVPAALGVVYVGWEWLGPQVPWRMRVRPVVTAGLVSVAVMEALGVVTRLGWGWVGALGAPGAVRSVTTPTTALGMLASQATRLVGLGAHLATWLAAFRGLGFATAGAVCLVLLLASEHLGSVRALALSLLVFVALGPVIQPWYFAWGLMCLAPVATRPWRRLLVWLSVYATALTIPDFPPALGQLGDLGALIGLGLAAVLVAMPSDRAVGWARRAGERVLARLRPSVSGRVAWLAQR